MLIKGLVIAGAGALMATAAFAQDLSWPAPRAQSSARAPTTVNPAPQAYTPYVTPSAAELGTDVVAISPDQARAMGIPVELVASAPVPDTPQNRAKYGAPLSNAGKQTAAKGN